MLQLEMRKIVLFLLKLVDLIALSVNKLGYNTESKNQERSILYFGWLNLKHLMKMHAYTGADPGFLERGFICIKVWRVRFADFISFLLNTL